MPEPKVYTVAEAAELLRCSPDCVRGHIAAGDLIARPIGQGTRRRRWIIPAASLDAFLATEIGPKSRQRRRMQPPPATAPTHKFLK